MCKYCKRLEEVRKNDRREYERIINHWKYEYGKLEDQLEVIQNQLDSVLFFFFMRGK